MPKKIHWGEMQGLYVAAGTGILAVAGAAAVAAVDNFERKMTKKIDALVEEMRGIREMDAPTNEQVMKKPQKERFELSSELTKGIDNPIPHAIVIGKAATKTFDSTLATKLDKLSQKMDSLERKTRNSMHAISDSFLKKFEEIEETFSKKYQEIDDTNMRRIIALDYSQIIKHEKVLKILEKEYEALQEIKRQTAASDTNASVGHKLIFDAIDETKSIVQRGLSDIHKACVRTNDAESDASIESEPSFDPQDEHNIKYHKYMAKPRHADMTRRRLDIHKS